MILIVISLFGEASSMNNYNMLTLSCMPSDWRRSIQESRVLFRAPGLLFYQILARA